MGMEESWTDQEREKITINYKIEKQLNIEIKYWNNILTV